MRTYASGLDKRISSNRTLDNCCCHRKHRTAGEPCDGHVETRNSTNLACQPQWQGVGPKTKTPPYVVGVKVTRCLGQQLLDGLALLTDKATRTRARAREQPSVESMLLDHLAPETNPSRKRQPHNQQSRPCVLLLTPAK